MTVIFGQHTPSDLTDNYMIYSTKLYFPAGSVFDTKMHFHVDKTEYLYVECGISRVTIDGVTRLFSPTDGEIQIPPWTLYKWEVLGGEETIVLERTAPADGMKEAFFRNLLGLVKDHGGLPPPLQAFKLFADWDNYPIGEAEWMKYMRTVIYILTKAAGWVGGVVGYSSMYKEYTPRELFDRLQ